MRFLVDECFPKQLVRSLRELGHDVTWGSEVCRSQPDELVLQLATAQGRIVITEDKDFSDLTIRDGVPAIGIVITQVDRFPGGIVEAVEALCQSIEALGQSLVGSVTVIELGRVRQRALSSPLNPDV